MDVKINPFRTERSQLRMASGEGWQDQYCNLASPCSDSMAELDIDDVPPYEQTDPSSEGADVELHVKFVKCEVYATVGALPVWIGLRTPRMHDFFEDVAKAVGDSIFDYEVVAADIYPSLDLSEYCDLHPYKIWKGGNSTGFDRMVRVLHRKQSLFYEDLCEIKVFCVLQKHVILRTLA